MDFLGWWVLPFLAALFLPHELGHVAAARKLGVRVTECAFGVPPRLVTRHWRAVRWTLNLLPLGMVVRLADVDERPPDQRLLIAAAGPLADTLVGALAALAWLLLPTETLGASMLGLELRVFLPMLLAGAVLQAVFNLLPVPPLDGLRVRAALQARRAGAGPLQG